MTVCCAASTSITPPCSSSTLRAQSATIAWARPSVSTCTRTKATVTDFYVPNGVREPYPVSGRGFSTLLLEYLLHPLNRIDVRHGLVQRIAYPHDAWEPQRI